VGGTDNNNEEALALAHFLALHELRIVLHCGHDTVFHHLLLELDHSLRYRLLHGGVAHIQPLLFRSQRNCPLGPRDNFGVGAAAGGLSRCANTTSDVKMQPGDRDSLRGTVRTPGRRPHQRLPSAALRMRPSPHGVHFSLHHPRDSRTSECARERGDSLGGERRVADWGAQRWITTAAAYPDKEHACPGGTWRWSVDSAASCTAVPLRTALESQH
jgi:hypothetical protein